MKCRKCDQRAAVNMHRHKLALCQDHYPEWVAEQVDRTIRKYHMFGPHERLLVAVSGGKDSLAVWDILLRLGYRADAMTIHLGIRGGFGYSDLSLEKVRAFAAAHPQAHLHVVEIRAERGESVPRIARRKLRGQKKPCAVCGLVKRHEMNRIAHLHGYDVLVTGHNLDDEVAALLGNVLHWQTGYLGRQAPVLQGREGLVRKVKPLCRLAEREIAAYAFLRDIDYVERECPFVEGNTTLFYKELLNQLEAVSPGSKLQFYVGFLRAREEGHFLRSADEVSLAPCPNCGQPTSAPDLCAFCRLWQSTKQRARMQAARSEKQGSST